MKTIQLTRTREACCSTLDSKNVTRSPHWALYWCTQR